jgi:hypothetical protein
MPLILRNQYRFLEFFSYPPSKAVPLKFSYPTFFLGKIIPFSPQRGEYKRVQPFWAGGYGKKDYCKKGRGGWEEKIFDIALSKPYN